MNLKLENFKKTFAGLARVKYFKRFLLILAGLAVLLSVFTAGVFVGMEKVRFSYGWRENYYRNFIGGRGQTPLGLGVGIRGQLGPGGSPPPFVLFGRPPLDDYFNAHGVFGEIISADTDTLVIKDKGNIEKNIALSARTIIKRHRADLKATDLKIGDQVVVIGSPNDQGQIEAKLIRVTDDPLNVFIK